MKSKNNLLYAALILAALIFSAGNLSAQDKSVYDDDYCSDNWSWNGNKSFKDRREFTLPNRNFLEVDGKQNGGISIRGENRRDILVRACVVAWRNTEAEAQNAAKQIKISTDSVIEAESADGNSWSVSYQILVPQNINLKLSANNGGISLREVEGNIEFFTKNGGVNLQNLAGDVSGKTQNGGISVKLAGYNWIGNGLNVETKNGGVKISMPENYAANIETGTTNGGFKSDFGQIQPENKKSWGKRVVNTSLNGGGAPVRIITTNGGIRIESL